jgi:hypothetical protein
MKLNRREVIHMRMEERKQGSERREVSRRD